MSIGKTTGLEQHCTMCDDSYMLDITHYQFFTKLKQLHFIEEISLYGSRARGDFRPTSDIDLAISCVNASTNDWLKILAIVEEADTLLKIDVVRFDQLDENEPLKAEILRDKKTLFKRDTHATT